MNSVIYWLWRQDSRILIALFPLYDTLFLNKNSNLFGKHFFFIYFIFLHKILGVTYMDMQEAMEGEETPDIAHRLQQTNETMQNIARNLGAVDQETRANTGTLAEHSAMLQGILQSLQIMAKELLPAMGEAAKTEKSSTSSANVYVPPVVEIPEKLIINSWDMAHLSSRLPSLEYHLGKYQEKSEPVKAAQIITENLSRELMREIASGKFVQYGIVYGNGPYEWNQLADLNYESLKSMLIILGRPQSAHQAAMKIKEIKVQISEYALGKSMLFSIDERLSSLRKYLEDIKIFHYLFFPATVPMFSKKDGKMEYYPLDSFFPPVYKQGDVKENPQSVLKMVEQVIVYERKLLNKVMFDSIFCSLSKGDPFHKVLLGVINDVVYEAAAQSGNAETIENLENARRKSIAVSIDKPISDLEEDDSSHFDVRKMFDKALQIKENDPGHCRILHVSPGDTSTPWYHGLINVAMYNIRVIEKYNGSAKELWSRMFEKPTQVKRQDVHSITAQDMENVAVTELMEGDHSPYGNSVSLSFIANQLQQAGKAVAEKEELEAEVNRLNALHPVKIDNRWSSNPKATEKRLPCYRAAHFGKCDKGDACRFSHNEGDLADLKQDPRYREWKSKLSPDDTSRVHALECDNANLQQEVNRQAELLFR